MPKMLLTICMLLFFGCRTHSGRKNIDKPDPLVSKFTLPILKTKHHSKRIGCYYFDPKNPYLSDSVLKSTKLIQWAWAFKDGKSYLVEGKIDESFFILKDKSITFDYIATICKESIPKDKSLLRFTAFNNSLSNEYGLIFADSSNKTISLNRLIVFGDSVSDFENMRRWISRVPTMSYILGWPYWLGRYSNGPVWPEYLSSLLHHLPIDNWSYGGQTTRSITKTKGSLKERLESKALDFATGNLQRSIKNYISSRKPAEPSIKNNLYIIWLGINNYWSAPDYTLDDDKYAIVETVKNLEDATRTLINIGAHNIILIGLAELRSYFKRHNVLLSATVKKLKAEYKNKNLIFISAQNYLSKFTTHFNDHGLNTTKHCYTGFAMKLGKLCDNPQDYFDFDSTQHPSTKVHCMLASAIIRELSNNGLVHYSKNDIDNMETVCFQTPEKIYPYTPK